MRGPAQEAAAHPAGIGPRKMTIAYPMRRTTPRYPPNPWAGSQFMVAGARIGLSGKTADRHKKIIAYQNHF
jgi:hypothetical protein